jgi:Flp pilus assembly protein TadD
VDLQSGRADSARRRADTLTAHPSPTVDGLLLAANTYARLNDLQRTEATLRRAMDMDPVRAEPYTALAEVYLRQGRAEDALREFRALAEQQPTSVAAHTMAGIILQQLNRTQDAKESYRKTLAVDANAAIAANNLAWLMGEANENLDEALQFAQTAKSRLPGSAEVADTLGWLYFKKGLAARAVEELRLAVERTPGNASFKYHLGLAYAKNGDLRLARETLEAALKLDPKAPEAAEARKTIAHLITLGS